MKRPVLLLVLPIITILTLGAQERRRDDVPNVNFRHGFNVVEATIPEMQAAMASGRVTSRELVLLYMSRIAQYEDLLNATAYVSRTALDEAELLDAERASGRIRGPLHGIPIALKDIINTTNMPTTGGALILEGFVPRFEAPLVTKLREAGAVIRQDRSHRACQLGHQRHAGQLQCIVSLRPESLRSTAGSAPRDQRRSRRHVNGWIQLGNRDVSEFLGCEHRN
jgi:hypothetical protein